MTVAPDPSLLLPRTLAGATIVQMIPALRDDGIGRNALNVAYMLLQSGARAVIAGEPGPLVDELKRFGGEWLAMPHVVANPFKIQRNATRLEQFIAAERVDIVHAQSTGAAWSALAATAKLPTWLVTNLPEPPSLRSPLTALHLRAAAQGDRVVVGSETAAAELGRRYNIHADRLSVIPRGIDTALFNPATVHPDRARALMRAWDIRPDEHVVLVPGPLAPWSGQDRVIDAARMLREQGLHGAVFVLLGDARHHRRYAQSLTRRIADEGLGELIRLPGRCADMPAAFAAASLVVVAATEAPAFGRSAIEAQAMGRPVVAAALGVLQEAVVVPPRVADDMRTGWLTPAGDVTALVQAIDTALSLDPEAFQAMAIRARQFAEYMYSPRSIAAAHRDVYTSLLARDH